MIRKPNSSRGGFTLVELLVAIAITGIIVSMAFRVGASANDLWRRQAERMTASRAGWQWVHRIARELRMAVPPGQAGAAELVGQSSTHTLLAALGDGDWDDETAAKLRKITLSDDTIRFTTARVPSDEELDLTGVVEYRLDRDESGHVIGISCRTAPLGKSLDDEEAWICTAQARSLGFEYLAADGQWVPEWASTTELPRAVRISVGTYASTASPMPSLMQFSTVVYLPAQRRLPL